MSEASMALRMKPLPRNPELERILKESAAKFNAMPFEEQEKMLRAQQQSWARQDMD
jgi:hypothetical protein